jgi:hypothetical protein
MSAVSCDGIVQLEDWSDEEACDVKASHVFYSTSVLVGLALVVFGAIGVFVMLKRKPLRPLQVDWLLSQIVAAMLGVGSCLAMIGKMTDVKCALYPLFASICLAAVLAVQLAKLRCVSHVFTPFLKKLKTRRMKDTLLTVMPSEYTSPANIPRDRDLLKRPR